MRVTRFYGKHWDIDAVHEGMFGHAEDRPGNKMKHPARWSANTILFIGARANVLKTVFLPRDKKALYQLKLLL